MLPESVKVLVCGNLSAAFSFSSAHNNSCPSLATVEQILCPPRNYLLLRKGWVTGVSRFIHHAVKTCHRRPLLTAEPSSILKYIYITKSLPNAILYCKSSGLFNT